jgi:hypothetical protein
MFDIARIEEGPETFPNRAARLAKRSMQTLMIGIVDVQCRHSTQISFGEHK